MPHAVRAAIVAAIATGIVSGPWATPAAMSAGAAPRCERGSTARCAGVDLSRRDLRRWRFRDADLRGTNLTRADLRGVDLRHARLDRANLVRADLRDADLRGAGLPAAALEQADLRRARLDRARFSSARLTGSDLRGAGFGTSFWTEADLTDARLGDRRLPAVGLCDTTLPDGSTVACDRPLRANAPAPSAPRVGGPPRLVTDLTRLVIRLIQRDRLNPPVASRVYAYTGIGLAESVHPNSLRLLGLDPRPAPDGRVSWATVAASGAPLVPRALSTVPSSRAAFAALRDDSLSRQAARVGPDRFRASVEYGRGLATRIAAWAATDGYAESRTRSYTAPVGTGLWVPTPATFQVAQEPYWGELRPFSASGLEACAVPAPPEYSTAADSDFMRETRAVYDISRELTDDQRAIARFWNDDRGRTGTPGGHWVATANIALARRHLRLGDAAQLHGTLGVAIGDAFIASWAVKYRDNEVRPVTAIRALVDPNWTPYLSTPPFPDWVSGHATVSGAAARVLTEIIGPMRYRDPGFSTGSDVRASLSITPRRFTSFEAAAAQATRSRAYGGIHIPASNVEGKRLGECVGDAALGAGVRDTAG